MNLTSVTHTKDDPTILDMVLIIGAGAGLVIGIIGLVGLGVRGLKAFFQWVEANNVDPSIVLVGLGGILIGVAVLVWTVAAAIQNWHDTHGDF